MAQIWNGQGAEKRTQMTLWTLGMGISGSLFATAIVYWVIERNLIHALVIVGAGIVVFLLTLLFPRSVSEYSTMNR